MLDAVPGLVVYPMIPTANADWMVRAKGTATTAQTVPLANSALWDHAVNFVNHLGHLAAPGTAQNLGKPTGNVMASTTAGLTVHSKGDHIIVAASMSPKISSSAKFEKSGEDHRLRETTSSTACRFPYWLLPPLTRPRGRSYHEVI